MPIFPPQNPPDATILDATSFNPPAASGIPTNVAKFDLMPDGWEETEGYLEDEDERGGFTTTRMYVGPWSSRAEFRLWVMGYSYRPGEVGVAASVSRTLPAQDPEHTFLYATSCRLVKAMGAWVVDPSNYAINADGSLASKAPGGGDGGAGSDITGPTIIPAIAFVNNSEGGSVVLDNDEPNVQQVGGQGADFLDGRCVFRVTYASRPYEIRSDAQASGFKYPEMSRFFERRYMPSIEALPMNKLNAAGGTKALMFSDPAAGTFNNQPIPEAGTLLLPTLSCEFRWYSVPDPPFDALFNLMGKVNLTAFDGPADGFGGYHEFDPETLLWMQPTWQRRPCDGTGAVLFDVVIRALFRPQTWNKFPVPSSRTFALATFGGDGVSKLYEPQEFHDVFVPSPVIKWF